MGSEGSGDPETGREGYWADDPVDAASYLRWFESGKPTVWVVLKNDPNTNSSSVPFELPLPALSADFATSAGTDAESRAKRVEAVRAELRNHVGQFSQSVFTVMSSARSTKDPFVKSVKSARKQVKEAKEGNRIASIGILSRAVLYEDRIKTPDGTYPLTPQVTASADQQGMKQVVQGWVFKSDQDRRELHLLIQGGTWVSLVSFNLKHSVQELKKLHKFANEVNQAAKRSTRAAETIASRTKSANLRLASALSSTSTLEQSLTAFNSINDDAVLAKAEELDFLVEANPDIKKRTLKKAISEIERARAQTAGANTQAESLRKELQDEILEAQREAEGLAASSKRAELRKVTEVLKGVAETKTEPPAGKQESGDRLDQLRRLKDVRDVLTREEFEAEKARILTSD